MFDNRLGLGVGTSPWPEDYEMMGVPFARRGKRMDECIDVIRGLTSGDYFEYHGEFYDIPSTKMTPAPTKPVPILVGGHADAALRRAARNDGWMHGGGDPAELDPLLAKLAQVPRRGGADRAGRRVPDPRHLDRRIQPRRHQAPGGQGRHRRHRRLPDSLHQGRGHRAAGRQDPQPGVVRRERHRQSERIARNLGTRLPMDEELLEAGTGGLGFAVRFHRFRVLRAHHAG